MDECLRSIAAWLTVEFVVEVTAHRWLPTADWEVCETYDLDAEVSAVAVKKEYPLDYRSKQSIVPIVPLASAASSSVLLVPEALEDFAEPGLSR